LLLTIAGHGFATILFPDAEPLVWLLGASLVAAVFSAPRGAVRWLLGGLMVVCVAARLRK
jgi:hypothetical protein